MPDTPWTSAEAYELCLQSIDKTVDERYLRMYGIRVDTEDEYRAYANRYNWRHPRRKISWRRLNRHQRNRATLDAVLTEGANRA